MSGLERFRYREDPFHDDWAKNVTSKPPPPPAGHVIQLTGTIFKLNSHIKKNAPPNVLTNFHDDWAMIVTSRVFTRKTAPHPQQLCYSTDQNHFRTQLSYQGNKSKIVTSRVYTCFHFIHIEKNAPPTGGHVFSPIWTIFALVRDINKTNVLTNFHDEWAKIVTSRVFTRKTAPPLPGSLVIELTVTIFELNSHIKGTNVLTKFHENWAKNVTSRVFTCFHYIHIENNAPPTGGHVFSPIWTIFVLFRDINKTNVLTNFHDHWAKIVTSRVFTRKTAPPPSSHVTELTRTIFELYSHIKETNVLTKFHENWAKNVTSRVFTCFHYIHKEKNAPPTDGNVFSPTWTIFKLI
ncbi:hypothetical protein DPMN_014130 [Dreissena polymorpha]|uniref:Uncharacterized protein n=1 Tax=Dreissena polymorpha TaxID=45954 RepID=A0A9D4N8L8_DREPO|nr:hypothetical protein DPMN_014130 [Dreissena polymorpha]